MREFIRSIPGKVCVAALILAVIVAGCWGGYIYWLYQQPKFHGLTMELGEELPDISQFLTEYVYSGNVTLVTAREDIDLTHAGDQTLTFQHDGKEETVTLTILDTTAPTAVFRDVTASIDAVLKPEDFVEQAYDLSGVTISFAKPLAQPESYGNVTVEILVADANGNQITGQCSVYYEWMHASFTMELGDTVEKSDLLLNAEKDADLIDQTVLDQINASPVGTYTVSSTDGGLTRQCVVTVQDTTAPELKLKSVKRYVNGSAKLEDFIESVSDISGEVETRLVTKLSFSTPGTQTVVIEATDINGNVTTMETTLEILKDATPPTFSGLSNMAVKKHSTPDYTAGVSAWDSIDGTVSFTYDAGKVDTSKAGTYYVTYTAADKNGNKASSRRKVVVEHDGEDTTALVKSIAATLSSDPEAIRDYVRSSIRYSTNWGGDDPVWYGFTNKTGNCYVHALCLQRLLTEKGYTTQLIWVKDKTHYWLIINLNGVWRHIDATPSTMHGRYSLMTDDQRYETLVSNGRQRDWDRSAWPACE